jgi:hypothetical protein
MSKYYEEFEIIRIQVTSVLKNIGWDLTNFFMGKTNTDKICLTRGSDNKQILIPIEGIKHSCIVGFCKKWLAKLKNIITNGFKENDLINPSSILDQKINQITTQSSNTIIEQLQTTLNMIDQEETSENMVNENIICDVGSVNITESCLTTWIVLFKQDFDGLNYEWPDYVKIKYMYKKVLHGMAIITNKDNIDRLKNEVFGIDSYVLETDVHISSVSSENIIDIPHEPLIVDTARQSDISNNTINHRDDINVFVLDTGINSKSNLNVKGGVNFTDEFSDKWVDRNGNGTIIASIIGASNNDIGCVGVAPGVQLWSIKVLNDQGYGLVGNIIAGFDWILNNRGTLWNGIGILSMSFRGPKNIILDRTIDTIINSALIPVTATGDGTFGTSYFSPFSPNQITCTEFSDISTSTAIITGKIVLLLNNNIFSGIGSAFVNKIKTKLLDDIK